MKRANWHYVITFIGVLLLFSIIRINHNNIYDFLYDIILSLVLTTIIDYVVVERPQKRRTRYLLTQTEHFNCFVVRAAHDLLTVWAHTNGYTFGNWTHLLETINNNKTLFASYEQYFSDFTKFLSDNRYQYYIKDSLDKINLVSLENDLVAKYSYDLSKFLTLFLDIMHSPTPLAHIVYSMGDDKEKERNIKISATEIVLDILALYQSNRSGIKNKFHSISIDGRIYLEAITIERLLMLKKSIKNN